MIFCFFVCQVLESRFTAETLASILCIPGNKTLLRRHLSTHFISLIGPDIQQQKRDAERQATFVPLNFIAKVKVGWERQAYYTNNALFVSALERCSNMRVFTVVHNAWGLPSALTPQKMCESCSKVWIHKPKNYALNVLWSGSSISKCFVFICIFYQIKTNHKIYKWFAMIINDL